MTAYNYVDIVISHGEDWADSLPWLVDDTRTPIDLTGRTLELYIRPRFNHATLLKRLYSSPSDPFEAGGGIFVPNAENGEAAISVPRETVIAEIPVGTWNHFLVLKGDVEDSPSQTTYVEVWRGKLTVLPART